MRTRRVGKPTWTGILPFLDGQTVDAQRDGTQPLAWRGDWSHEVSLLASFTCCWTHCFRAVGTAMQASNATIKNRGGLFQSRAFSVMPLSPGLSRAGWFKPKLGWLTCGGQRRRQRFVSTDAVGASICQTAVVARHVPGATLPSVSKANKDQETRAALEWEGPPAFPMPRSRRSHWAA